ncbi:MAG: rhomboid family intramembrane serine protease, partial [bacterium (Candidatus Stahlbacteria) CG08_land_8_20_14_0_20_40_26]
MIPLRDNIPAKKFPFVTYLLILINVALFIYELTLGKSANIFVSRYGCIPYEITRAKDIEPYIGIPVYFTLLSSMFLHGSWWHLVGNMLFLFIFGDNVEDWWGHRRYILMYILFGLIAASLQILVSSNSRVPFIGASGAIAGVMGSYFFLYPHAKVNVILIFFFFIRIVWIPAFLFLGFWILLQILYGFLTPPSASNIAFFAHIGGFFGGLLLTRQVVKRRLIGWR